MSTSYPSNLSDAEWSVCNAISLPCPDVADRQLTLCEPSSTRSSTCCAPVAAFSYLPANFPPWQTVFYHFRRLRLKGTWFRLLTTLRGAERERVGRNLQPSAAIMDAKTCQDGRGIRWNLWF